MTIAQEEIFGPVLAVVRAPDLSQAIRIANSSRFGNASVIFTKDGRSAREFRYRIEAGMLGVNIGVPAPAAYFPFVGWKGSFFGDLHANGRDAVEFYTRKKVITTRWSWGIRSSFPRPVTSPGHPRARGRCRARRDRGPVPRG